MLRLELLEDRALLAQIPVFSVLDDGSAGTLRSAITQANTTAGADEIVFDANVFSSPQTITLTSGQLTIIDALTITGPGADRLAVSGNHTSRVFEIGRGVITSLSGITVRDGVGSGGGGIYNQGELTVSNSVITRNLAEAGGGIYSTSGYLYTPGLTVLNSTITYNSASNNGGGILGGGTISNSTISNNSASNDGGGMWGNGTIENSTFANNFAGNDGGGFSGSRGIIANSTFVSNSAGHDGGGISLHFGILTNVTLTENRCNSANSGGKGGGMSIQVLYSGLLLTLNNSIIAGNFSGNDPSSAADDVSGTLDNRSTYNLIGVGGAGGLQDRAVNPFANNQVGVANPGLGQLGFFGGPTQTIPLIAGSPAVAGGSKTLALAFQSTDQVGFFSIRNVLDTDQRGPGFSRFTNSTIDIGAFQSQLAPARKTLTVITTDDSGPGSLRQAIQENNLAGGGNTIVFSLPPAQTITLTTGELQVIQDVKIVGPGANQLAVNGNLTNRIFGVYGSSPVYYTTVESTYLDTVSSTISGLRIENGKVASYPGGGGIYVEASLTVSNCSFSNNSSDYGGAISNSGRLIVNNSTFNNNAAGGGGAIANSGVLIINNSTLNNNSANFGGGAIYNNGNLVVSRSTLANNNSEWGGGIYTQGYLTIIGSTFVGNSATSGGGGGIFFGRYSLGLGDSISDSTFSYNSASFGGGGIFYDRADSRSKIINSTFFGNSTVGSGGGIYSETTLVLKNVTIAYNNAAKGGGLGLGGSAQAWSSNSIIAQNVASVGPDIFGRMLSFGYNLVGIVGLVVRPDLSIGTSGMDGYIFIRTGIAGDVWSIDPSNRIDPLLGPIGNYGGLTPTMPLLLGSPALDAGSNNLAVDVAGTPLTVDQRGSSRIVNGTVDMGAFESRASNVISAISAPLDGFQGVSSQTRSFALSATNPSLSPANIASYVVNWGDGSRLEAYPAVLNGATATHAFPIAGNYTISVSALDAAGDIGVPNTRTIRILSTESQGPVFAVGGTSAEDVSADDTLTLTPVTATTATLNRNATNLGTFNQSVYSNGVHFFGGTGNDTVVFKGTTAGDQFTTTVNSVALNSIVLQGQDVEKWSINALAGNDTITIISGTLSVDGGTGTDKIIAADVPNLWTISIANAGTLNDQAFSRVESLTGGTDDDVFQYIDSGSLGGAIDGGLGINTLDYSQRPTKVNVNLLTLKASGTSGIANLQYFVGSQASDDTLTAPATPNTWTIFEENFGDLNGVTSFYGFESLVGGSADDTFLMQPAGSIGTLNGGGGPGIDRLELQDRGTSLDVSVSTTGRSVQGVVGTFSALEQVESLSASSDRLLGGIANTSWSVNALGQVVVSAVTYIGFDEIAGGSGVDTLTGPASETTWNIAGSNSGQVSASGLNYAFSGIENLTGGVAEDIFVFQPSGIVSGNVNGGTGIGNTISYAAWTLGVGVNLTNPIAAGNATAVLGTLKNISIVMGGTGNDILIGNSSAPTVLVGNAGDDTLTGLAGRDILIGGVGADTLSGAGGEDILIGGSTAHDSSHTALLKIQLEWRDTTRVFALRVNNLRGIGVDPRSNESYFFNTDTVFADLETDSLTGGNGKDWFWGDLSEILDFKSSGSQSDLRN